MKHKILFATLISVAFSISLLTSSMQASLTSSIDSAHQPTEEQTIADEISEMHPRAVATTAKTDDSYLTPLWNGINQIGAAGRWLARIDSEKARQQLCNQKNIQLQEGLINNYQSALVDIEALTRETSKRQEAENLLFPLMFKDGDFNVHQDNRNKVIEILKTWKHDFPPILKSAALLYIIRCKEVLAESQQTVDTTGDELEATPTNYLPSAKQPEPQPEQ